MNNKKGTLLKRLTYFLVFFLPLFYLGSNVLYPHITPKTYLFYAVTEILTALWIYTIVVDLSSRPNKKVFIFLIPLGLYVLWMTLASFFAVNPALSFWSSFGRGMGLLTLYHSVFLLLVVVSLASKFGKEYIHNLFYWFVTGGFFLALTIWMGTLGFNLPYKFLQIDGGGGLSGNSSLGAGYLLLVLALGLFLFLRKDITKNKKWWIGISLATILFSPIFIDIRGFIIGHSILGNARGATLGIVVSIGVAFVSWLILTRKKALRISGVLLAVASLIVFSFLWSELVNPTTKIHQKFTEVAKGTRFIFWDVGQKAMAERPWFGYGPENYMIAFGRYFDPKMILPEYNHEGWNDRAHNIYYDTGVSGGYPAILLYSLFILSIVYGLYKAHKNQSLSSLEASILIGVVVGYIFQDLFYFDSVLSYTALFSIAGVSYVLGAGISNGVSLKEKNNIKSIDPYFKNGLAIILGIGCVFSITYLAYRPLKKANMYPEVFGVPFNKPFKKLSNVSPVGNGWDISALAHDTYKALSSDPLKTKNNKEVLPYVLKDLDNLIKYLETIAKENKTDFRLYISLIELYNTKIFLSDAPQDPVLTEHLFDLVDTAHKLSPTNPEVYWLEAQLYSWSKDFENIIKSYKKAIDLDPSVVTNHELLLRFLRAIGDQKRYKEAFVNAQKNIPNFKLD